MARCETRRTVIDFGTDEINGTRGNAQRSIRKREIIALGGRESALDNGNGRTADVAALGQRGTKGRLTAEGAAGRVASQIARHMVRKGWVRVAIDPRQAVGGEQERCMSVVQHIVARQTDATRCIVKEGVAHVGSTCDATQNGAHVVIRVDQETA